MLSSHPAFRAISSAEFDTCALVLVSSLIAFQTWLISYADLSLVKEYKVFIEIILIKKYKTICFYILISSGTACFLI
jgi:hypothetical protein